MSVAAEPVRLDFDDYVRYTETHPDGAFEPLDGAIFKMASEGDAHLGTRSASDWILNRTLDLARYAPWTEASFPTADWFDGPRPDNFVSFGPGIVNGEIKTLASAVFVRDDVGWLITSFHNTREQQPPGPPD